MLQKSLNRLSSGSRITNASDDAGGVAVASRLSASAKRAGVIGANIGNALSYLQNQDSTLKTMGKMLERMSELQTLHLDTTKQSDDKLLYQDEFTKLQAEYDKMAAQEFNGKRLFGASANLTITVNEQTDGSSSGVYKLTDNSGEVTSASTWGITDAAQYADVAGTAAITANTVGAKTLIITDAASTVHTITFGATDSVSTMLATINGANAGVAASTDDNGALVLKSNKAGSDGDFVASGTALSALFHISSATGTAAAGADNIKVAIGNIAEARAKNGADQSVLGYYAELNTSTKTNFESAVSKIMDVDVAEESTQLARWNTLVQAGTAMIAQANGSTQSALTLLR
jgi:flagellin